MLVLDTEWPFEIHFSGLQGFNQLDKFFKRERYHLPGRYTQGIKFSIFEMGHSFPHSISYLSPDARSFYGFQYKRERLILLTPKDHSGA